MPKSHLSRNRAEADYDQRRATAARGHDDQGGSRQNESRDYDRRLQRSASEVARDSAPAEQNHGKERHDRERYGEQTPGQRRESAKQAGPEHVGGQDSRDQSAGDRFSLLGRAGGTGGERRDEAVEPQQRQSAGDAAGEPYASDTRDNFSREYAEYRRREEQRRDAPGGGDYDTNWTGENKPPQPGPGKDLAGDK